MDTGTVQVFDISLACGLGIKASALEWMNLLTICTLRICACVYRWHIAQRLGMAVFMLFL
jgi:hypothetical protein